jgi:hypothetical protein
LQIRLGGRARRKSNKKAPISYQISNFSGNQPLRNTARNEGYGMQLPTRRLMTPAVIYFFGGTTASLNALATRNFTTVFAGILIAAPV